MSSDPKITTFVYILIVVVFVAVVAYMIFYNRSVKSKQAALNEKGRLPISKQEGIAIATEEKERSGSNGSNT